MSNKTQPTLGVVTISFNEEQDLPGFLSNLLDWVDEIVIVDDGSSDRTKTLAEDAGDKVKFIASPRSEGEYFSHQRNKGIDAAKSDWLLHMDVDERVSPELSREILAGISNPDMDGFRFRRLNYFMHRPMKGGGWRDWNLVHLARREKFKFGGMFHESCHLDAREGAEGQLSELMIHYNEDNLEKRFRKSGLYLDELVKRAEARSKPVRFVDIAGRPLVDFLRKYVLKRGFLDGIPGFISAIHSATAVFRANALVWDKQNAISREQIEADFTQSWHSDRR